jgi:hypothetical protein
MATEFSKKDLGFILTMLSVCCMFLFMYFYGEYLDEEYKLSSDEAKVNSLLMMMGVSCLGFVVLFLGGTWLFIKSISLQLHSPLFYFLSIFIITSIGTLLYIISQEGSIEERLNKTNVFHLLYFGLFLTILAKIYSTPNWIIFPGILILSVFWEFLFENSVDSKIDILFSMIGCIFGILLFDFLFIIRKEQNRWLEFIQSRPHGFTAEKIHTEKPPHDLSVEVLEEHIKKFSKKKGI